MVREEGERKSLVVGDENCRVTVGVIVNGGDAKDDSEDDCPLVAVGEDDGGGRVVVGEDDCEGGGSEAEVGKVGEGGVIWMLCAHCVWFSVLWGWAMESVLDVLPTSSAGMC